MRKLLKRWYVWLGISLFLVGLTSWAALFPSSQGRITQARFDTIKDGMSDDEVTAILGRAEPELTRPSNGDWEARTWRNGPNVIAVAFRRGVVIEKRGHIATAWQTLQWY